MKCPKIICDLQEDHDGEHQLLGKNKDIQELAQGAMGEIMYQLSRFMKLEPDPGKRKEQILRGLTLILDIAADAKRTLVSDFKFKDTEGKDVEMVVVSRKACRRAMDDWKRQQIHQEAA